MMNILLDIYIVGAAFTAFCVATAYLIIFVAMRCTPHPSRSAVARDAALIVLLWPVAWPYIVADNLGHAFRR